LAVAQQLPRQHHVSAAVSLSPAPGVRSTRDNDGI